MIALTQKERETLLVLLKDYTAYYNANSISKVLSISHVGAQKIFKRLIQDNLVVSKNIGKSIIYKLNFNSIYVNQMLAFLLADEANKFKRWTEEFKDFFKKDRMVVLFGSVVKDYVKARDVDILIIAENNDVKEINTIINKKEMIMPKKLHVIKLSQKDLLKNLKKHNKAMIDIVKNAIVLYGQEIYVGMMKNVASI